MSKSESKHTPGPHKANTSYTIVRDGVRHYPIHAAKRGLIGLALREGDAHLWAAAPCLLAAMQGLLRVADMATEEFAAARAAIAKATSTKP